MIPSARPLCPTSSDHYFLKDVCFVLRYFETWVRRRTDGNTCESNDHYRPRLGQAVWINKNLYLENANYVENTIFFSNFLLAYCNLHNYVQVSTNSDQWTEAKNYGKANRWGNYPKSRLAPRTNVREALNQADPCFIEQKKQKYKCHQ